MDPGLYRRAKDVLIATLERPVAQRDAFLRRTCADDPTLLAEVQSLLERQDAASSIVDEGVIRINRALPDRIGPYEVLDVLGEGGMGRVYRGRQTQPIEREVAIKVLHAGLNTERILERFAWERRSLARMNHPNIARILDAGADEAGHPYVVLELIDGTPITTWCREHRGDIPRKLMLMSRVCEAVQHAHDRGVLHRDLKPGNILVREIDGRPTPFIIDFGIAKALDDTWDGTEKLELTLEGQRVGTPAYMSPEQLAGGGEVDVRTDVYALGVILYELLAGQRPFPDEHLQRSLQRESPPAPSRISGRRELRGDLDNICLMAIRPEAERRYHSATELAADLARHREGRPVLASPDSWRYRFGKTARRHPILSTLSLAVLVFMVVGVGFLAYHARRLNSERNRALAAEKLARQEASAAEEIAAFMAGLFDEMDPIVDGAAPTTAIELLDRGAARLDGDLVDQPGNRGRLWSVMGRVNQNIARYDVAEDQLHKSLAAYADVGDSNATLPERAELYRMLATNLHDQGRYEEAETVFRHAVTTHRRAYPQIDLARVQLVTDLATAIQAQGRLLEAQSQLDEALALAESLGDEGQAEVAYIRNIRGYVLYQRGAYIEASRDMDAALAVNRRLYPGDSMDLVGSLNNVGGMALEMGHYALAGSLLVESRDMVVRIFQGEPHPAVTRAQKHLARLALVTGDTTTAIHGFERCYEQSLAQLGPDNPHTWSAMESLAEARHYQGRFREAGDLFRRAIGSFSTNIGPHAAKTLICRERYGRFLLATGQLAGARRQLEAVVAAYQADFEPDHPKRHIAEVDLAEVLLEVGDANGARKLLQGALPELGRVFGTDYRTCVRARELLRRAG